VTPCLNHVKTSKTVLHQGETKSTIKATKLRVLEMTRMRGEEDLSHMTLVGTTIAEHFLHEGEKRRHTSQPRQENGLPHHVAKKP
jgi:hypothetical protein